MKKFLLLSSCGILLATMLGAAGTLFGNSKAQLIEIPLPQCGESSDFIDSIEKSCSGKIEEEKLHGELFLRSLQKKRRMVLV
ncbi:MAG: hypothetical protein KC505_06100 [Myxococcales bacterium]|nr:hypothetical protein [Myxococcales bacterium]USN50018.1 MAG: hypothetical protein H6731_07015 [Myxococcales bacterium]